MEVLAWYWDRVRICTRALCLRLTKSRGEYPAGSVACAESTGELKEGHRNRWFIMFTNVQIDIGFVASTLAPMIVVLACTENHLRAAWRICLGLGVIPPLSLIYLRLKLQEPEEFNRETMKNTRTPWLLVFKYVEICATRLLIWSDADIGQVLLGPPSRGIYDLVHLRLLILLILHLLIGLAYNHPWRFGTHLEVLRLEHHYQPLLSAGRNSRCFSKRHSWP